MIGDSNDDRYAQRFSSVVQQRYQPKVCVIHIYKYILRHFSPAQLSPAFTLSNGDCQPLRCLSKSLQLSIILSLFTLISPYLIVFHQSPDGSY